MAILRNTTFQGVSVQNGRVNAPINVEDLRKIARDQALVFEKLTNANAEGGGGTPPTNTGHNHTEAGNLLFWPIMSQQTGSSARGVSPDNGGLHIENTFNTIEDVIWAFPVFIPDGFAGKDFWVILDCGNGESMWINLFDGATTPAAVAGQQRRYFRPMTNGADQNGNRLTPIDNPERFRTWVSVFTPASAGLHTIFLIADRNNTRPFETRDIESILIMPVVESGSVGVDSGRKSSTTWSTDQVQVGDPDATVANDWHEIDEAFATSDGALDAIITLLAGNDALLQEAARGIPATGNSALTLPQVAGGLFRRGHDHSEDNPTSANYATGDSLSYAVGSWAFGAHDPDPAVTGGLSLSPKPTDSVFSTFTQIRAFLHNHDKNTAASGSSLRAAVLTFRSAMGADRIEVKVANVGEGVSYETGIISADGYTLTVLGPMDYGVEQVNDFRIDLKEPNGKVTQDSSLVGMCLYFAP